MPAAVSPFTGAQHTEPTDDIDGLFDDLLGDNTNGNASTIENRRAENQSKDLDEEIKVTRKRKPVAKLDETR